MNKNLRPSLLFLAISLYMTISLPAQVVINEGSNRNYSNIADENGDFPDWIELFNSSQDTVNLLNYSLTDKYGNPSKWTFPNVKLAPGEFRTVFCSGKDRKPVSGFVNVINTGSYNPHTGWNTHGFSEPFYWDGVSNILINTCSYSSTGYTVNSVFNQTPTEYLSTSFAFQDGSPGACSNPYLTRVAQRPNMKLNGHTVGTGVVQNSPYDYPAPYGNWYWGARHQMLIRASELTEAALTAGYINSLSFYVAWTEPNTWYDYVDIYMRLVSYDEVPLPAETVDTNNFLHTNFKISSEGETVYLFSPTRELVSQLFIDCGDLDNSRGRHPDASQALYLFQRGTPSASNNPSGTYNSYLLEPVFSMPSGCYDEPIAVSMVNPNTIPSSIHYTIDGSEPSPLSPLYSGEPIEILYSVVLKARAFAKGVLPSPNAVSSYLFGVDHATPVISVITAPENLYGETGIFDNWWTDWEKTAYVEYFDEDEKLVFSQRSGMQIDGGWGGARSHPQHSFRLELDDGVLGDGPVYYPLVPGRPDRLKYGRFYLRNGSNQYLVYPYKDACAVTMMGSGTQNYYSAWGPASVYINGYYHGLYELREKMDDEYFEVLDGADPDKTDILSMTAWYGFALRAVRGSVDPFYEDVAAFRLLNPADTSFWHSADQLFDMEWYNDYIIGESWIGNTDWPWNNIKIYRSDATGYRWRFCLMDLELAMQPNGWTDCYYDHISYMRNYDPADMYLGIWLKGIQNNRFRDYFINRFADVMNTAYLYDHLSAIENDMFLQTVVEMPREYARWGDPNHIPEQMMNFTANHQVYQSQLSERTAQVRNHIQANFGLPNQVEVTLNVYPEGAGKIHISTISPGEYPWQGIYFNGVPVKLEAIPNEDYAFINWGDNGLIANLLDPVFLDTLDADAISFDAYFEYLATNVGEKKPVGMTVYPNPAHNRLYISGIPSSGAATYRIMEATGKTLAEGTLPGNSGIFTLETGSLTPSVYILLITTPEGTCHHRFIKI